MAAAFYKPTWAALGAAGKLVSATADGPRDAPTVEILVKCYTAVETSCTTNKQVRNSGIGALQSTHV